MLSLDHLYVHSRADLVSLEIKPTYNFVSKTRVRIREDRHALSKYQKIILQTMIMQPVLTHVFTDRMDFICTEQWDKKLISSVEKVIESHVDVYSDFVFDSCMNVQSFNNYRHNCFYPHQNDPYGICFLPLLS